MRNFTIKLHRLSDKEIRAALSRNEKPLTTINYDESVSSRTRSKVKKVISSDRSDEKPETEDTYSREKNTTHAKSKVAQPPQSTTNSVVNVSKVSSSEGSIQTQPPPTLQVP